LMSATGQQRRFRDVRIMSASLNSRHGDGGSLTAQFVQSPSSMRLTAPSLALLAGNGRRLLLGGIEGKRLTYRATIGRLTRGTIRQRAKAFLRWRKLHGSHPTDSRS
jgi:hypothetical protein